MEDLHAKINDTTAKQVKAVLGDRPLDDFTDEALKRHARREYVSLWLQQKIDGQGGSGFADDDVLQELFSQPKTQSTVELPGKLGGRFRGMGLLELRGIIKAKETIPFYEAREQARQYVAENYRDGKAG